MKNKKFSLLSLILATAMSLATVHESQSALSIINGDFQDTSGLTVDVPGAWYGGVPASWSGVNGSFSVRDLSGNLLANLNVLSTTSPSFVPLKQSVGLLDSTSIVTLSYNITDLTGSGFTMKGGIFNTQGSSEYGNWIALALPAEITAAGLQTLSTAAAIQAGTQIGVAFWASVGAPGIDNVNVIPEPSAFSLMAAGSCLTFVLAARRRRQS